MQISRSSMPPICFAFFWWTIGSGRTHLPVIGGLTSASVRGGFDPSSLTFGIRCVGSTSERVR